MKRVADAAARRIFPDTAPRNMAARLKARALRRSRNKAARAARKRNRS